VTEIFPVELLALDNTTDRSLLWFTATAPKSNDVDDKERFLWKLPDPTLTR
jgi:hypothetical protein